jgi:nitronate monooxygenase
VDAVVSGAGLPLELPGIVGTKEVAIAPIVSSARAAKLILRRWAKAFDRTADFVVIEGCKAGGHLGFAEEDLLADRCQTLDEILPGVLAEVKPYEAQYGHTIPVFVAGGVYTGADMAHFTKLGAAGVQLATRFIPTYECDASQTYKNVLLAAKPEDVRIIHSPVGMPGRALNTPLVQAMAEGKRFAPKHCARCLKTCDPAAVPYCITHALIEAVKGNVEEGLFFCGENVGRLDRMRTVRELMDELVTEWRQNL